MTALKILTLSQVGSAVALIVVAIIALSHGGDVTTSRRFSAYDSCRLNRGLVLVAVKSNPKEEGAAQHYIAETPLRDCRLYALRIVK